jgi:hypothetical protein
MEILDELSSPMRKYIIGNVLNIVCDGLMDTCLNGGKEDPIDYLAEYLFKNY